MLSRDAILWMISVGDIEIEPSDNLVVGPNSVDIHLGLQLKTYHPTENRVRVVDPDLGSTFLAIDPKNPPPLVDVPKTADGRWLLVPGRFYLGETLERTKTIGVVAHLDGRSTCGRLSIEAHKTAGVGDNGFDGKWTLEIEATEPVLVTPGDRLFQIYFSPCLNKRGIQDLEERHLEQSDLYAKGGVHHYQDSTGVRGPAPLD